MNEHPIVPKDQQQPGRQRGGDDGEVKLRCHAANRCCERAIMPRVRLRNTGFGMAGAAGACRRSRLYSARRVRNNR